MNDIIDKIDIKLPESDPELPDDDDDNYLPFKPGDVCCTCTECILNDTCIYAWDWLNRNGECLLDR
jgi:hypothetical protein